jgi:hypothetical protein
MVFSNTVLLFINFSYPGVQKSQEKDHHPVGMNTMSRPVHSTGSGRGDRSDSIYGTGRDPPDLQNKRLILKADPLLEQVVSCESP